MDVLIAPIGSSDPYSERRADDPGPALTLASCRAFDLIFLLYTRHPSGEKTRVVSRGAGQASHDVLLDYNERAEATRDAIAASATCPSANAAFELVPLVVENPADYCSMLAQTEQAVQQIKDRLRELAGAEFPDLRLYISAASGTPAIKAAMILLTSSGQLTIGETPPEVYQIADPWYASTDEQRVSTVDVTVVEAARLVDHAIRLLRSELLESASEDLRRLCAITPSSTRRRTAFALIAYLEALQQHRRLAYGAARNSLRKLSRADRTRQPLEPIADLIQQQIAALTLLHDGEDAVARTHDLVLSVERQRQRGEYVDAVGRSWQTITAGLRERAHAGYAERSGAGLAAPVLARLEQQFQNPRHYDASGRLDLAALLGPQARSLSAQDYREILDAFADAPMQASLNAPLSADMRTQFNKRLGQQLCGPHKDLQQDLWRRFRYETKAHQKYRHETSDELARALIQSDDTCIETFQDVFNWINIVRNRSVIAHGFADVDAVDALGACFLLRQIVAAFVGLPADEHPFGPHSYERTVTWMREALIAV